MDRTTLRVVLGWLLGVLCSAPGQALDSRTTYAVQAATFEFYAPGAVAGAKGLVGTAFAIGPNQFVTTAHLLDTAVGSRFGRPVLVDSRRVEYRIGDILQYSEQRDYVIFSLQRPPRIQPLTVQSTESAAGELYFAGWKLNGVVSTERGTFSGLTRDSSAAGFDWLRFSGPVWGAAGGGPVVNGSGQVIGIVQGVSLKGEANYAVPIEVVSGEPPNKARLHGTEILRFLMPTVSSVEPLQAEIPLPMAWDDFSREVQQLRRAYFDRMVGPLLESTQRKFLMTGDAAADTCSFLNGRNCECKPRTDASGVLLINESPTAGANQLVETSDSASQMVAGVGLVRTFRAKDRSARDSDPVSNAAYHLEVALRASTRSDLHLDVSRQARLWVAQGKDGNYVDFRNRNWHIRKWPLLDRDLEVISMVRALPDGYIVLTRTVPTAVDYGAELQLEFVANLIYYQCEELSGEGVARLAAAGF
jgi:hypothetical protein